MGLALLLVVVMELFVIIVIVWFVISLWGNVFKSGLVVVTILVLHCQLLANERDKVESDELGDSKEGHGEHQCDGSQHQWLGFVVEEA